MSTELASLYNIEGAIVTLMEMRAEAEAEGDAQQLAVIDRELDAWIAQEIRKVDNIANYIRECERRAEIASHEADRLDEQAEKWQKRADRVRASSLAAMQQHGVKVVETPQNTIRRQRNGGSECVEIVDAAAVPDNLSNITVTLPVSVWIEMMEMAEEASGGNRTYRDIVKPASNKGILTPNLSRIREALKRGDAVPGARLLERGEHLRLS